MTKTFLHMAANSLNIHEAKSNLDFEKNGRGFKLIYFEAISNKLLHVGREKSLQSERACYPRLPNVMQLRI